MTILTNVYFEVLGIGNTLEVDGNGGKVPYIQQEDYRRQQGNVQINYGLNRKGRR